MGLFSRNKELRTCDACHKRGNSKHYKKQIVENTDGKFHRECYHQLVKRKEGLKKAEQELKRDSDFNKIIQNFDSGFEAIIEIQYDKSHKSRSRYFFGNEKNELTQSKDFFIDIKKNYLHICLIPTEHKFLTHWNKEKGNFNIGDDFDAGYSGIISFKKEDSELRTKIINLFMKHGFGCLPSSYTIHAHKNDENPNQEDAKKILRDIVNELIA